ncbi:MAG TPA: hypothetical protein PKC39_13305 [Ferruginibacter sp.]|nr:hypothetical protein [Ferruginibacter sp.]HMP21931.1 hypothetical protein [Ferruginibacter sp.]
MLLIAVFTSSRLNAQTTIFSQDFNSSSTLSNYVSLLLPDDGQFNAISTGGTSSASISGGALRFTRGNTNTSFTRSTDFSPVPTAITYQFTMRMSGLPSGNTNSALRFQVGSGYNILTNNAESNGNTYAHLGIDIRGTSNFRFRNISSGTTSSDYNVNTFYTVTWTLNNSGSSLTYQAPDGSTETVANDRADVWVGNTRIFNDVTVQTTGGSLADLKFAFTASSGTIDIDDINIYSINPFITSQPASITRCVGASASFSAAASGTSLSYRWRKGTTNLNNGGNISGATTATLTINPAGAGDSGDYNVVVTSSGGYAAVSDDATLTVSALPTITSAATLSTCYSAGAQAASLSYSATTNSPTHYTITWNAAALAAGLVNVGTTALPASPITVPVAAGVAAGSYTGTLTVTNAAGCTSNGNNFTLTIQPLPTITLSGNALSRCFSPGFQNTGISYSATTNSPTHYTVVWDAAAQAAGLNNVGSTVLSASPVYLPVTAGVAPGTYNGTFYVLNANGCSSTGIAFTFTVRPLPTITASALAKSVCYNEAAQNSSIAYSATTNSPTQYSIIWDADALTAGLSNAAYKPVTSSPLSISVAGAVASGTHNGILAVRNVFGCESIPNHNFSITIGNDNPVITSAAVTEICSGSTLSFSLTSSVPSTFTWVAADNPNVSGESTTLQTGELINNTLFSLTGNEETVIYTVTPVSIGGCTGASQIVTVTVHPLPGISTAASSGNSCFSTLTRNTILTYSSTENNPTHYSVSWDATGLAAGLKNVVSTVIPPEQFSIPVAAGSTPGTYTGTLIVSDVNGCASTGSNFSFTINPLPTITASATAETRCVKSTSQTTTISYTAVTNSPTGYRITWNSAAVAAGFSNIGLFTITSSPLIIQVPAAIPAGTYNGVLNVLAASGCISINHPFTFTVNNGTTPVITSTALANTCSGSSMNLPLTADLPSSFSWVAASNANVTGESTTMQYGGTINNTLTLTPTVAQNVLYTVRAVSTAGGCQSDPQTVTVTVYPVPTITAAATAASRCYSSSTQTTTLTYSAATGAASQYSVIWNAAAQAAGLVNVNNAALASSPIIIPVAAAVSAGTHTGILRVSNAGSCNSADHPFTFTVTAAPAITSHPANQTVCSGASASFSIAATGSSLTYQWRRGTANLSNGGNISGATSATLTINPSAPGDAAADYNCVVTGASCSGVISNFATLTVNEATQAPTDQPTVLIFPSVNVTSITGSFTPAATATHYLVIRKTTNVAPTNPSNGTTYTQGASALTGVVDYVGTGTSFSSNGLSPNTTYYYWVFAYNIGACGTSPRYFTASPLAGNATTATTVACGTIATLYWAGSGSAVSGRTSGTVFNTAANWSTNPTNYVASPTAPGQCNNVSLALTSSVTITLNANADVYNLNYTVSGSGITGILSVQGNRLNVYGNAVVDVLSGNTNTNIYIGENSNGAGIVDFKANFRLGETYFAGSIPKSYLVGNVNSKIIFRGDVLFGRTSRVPQPGGNGYPPPNPIPVPGTGTAPGTIEFDGLGLQQVLWNNNVWYDNFYNIVVGNENQPYVKHVTGTYTPDNIYNNLTINNGATVDLGTSQWIREQQGGTFTMNGTAKLILGNYRSILSSPGTGVVVPGSNFPGGYSTLNISPNSTIEYNGGNNISQTVYGTPSIGSLTYGNLILTNGSGTVTAAKITTSTVTVAGSTTVNDKATLTLGAGLVSNGVSTVASGGRVNCGNHTISGTGSFNVSDGGTLGIGSASGIRATCACGNVQTAVRGFSTAGNYVYYGSSAQVTGDGLPKTMNDLTIENAAGVTMHAASANYTVAGTLTLTTGALSINGDTLTINNLQRTSGTLTGSASSSVGITGSGVPLFFTSGSRILKDLFVANGASADLQTTLDITAGNTAGSVAVGNGSILNTYGLLTLKSDANGTARVGQIPVNGAGTALGSINGNVRIERFIPAKRGWRMMTSPIQATGASTINTAWQEGVVNTDFVYSNNLNPNPGFGVHISGSSPDLGFDPTPQNNPSLLVFSNSTSAWSGVDNTLSTLITDYPGYMLFVRGSRATNLVQNQYAPSSSTVLRVLGRLNMGRKTITVPAGSGSYAVAGNPYCSTIDLRQLTSTGGVSVTNFAIWDPALTGNNGVGAYQYFTRSGGAGSNYTVFPGGGSYGPANSVHNSIQAGQAFLVQKNTSAGTLVFNESAKLSSSTSAVFRPFAGSNTGRISTLLYGAETNGTYTLLDGAMHLYKNDFADEVDTEDAVKLRNLQSENIGISKGAHLLQIERKKSLGEADTILYNIRSMRVRKYKMEIDIAALDAAAVTAWLEDNYTKIKTPLALDAVTTYPFTVTADSGAWAPGRFRIVFNDIKTLPVTFTTVKAQNKGTQVAVQWKVENEKDILLYEVEQSADGNSFEKAHTVTSVKNTGKATYEWIHTAPLSGANYFRIKSIDRDGTKKYSTVVKVVMEQKAGTVAVYPNPVQDGVVNIFFKAMQAGKYQLRLMNTAGQLVQQQQVQLTAGNARALMQMGSHAFGTYQLEVIKPDGSIENIRVQY